MNYLTKMAFYMVLSLFTASMAHSVRCEGKVKEVAISSGGEVRLVTDFRSIYFTVCNVNGTWNSIAATTCMAWMSQAQLAYNNNRNLTIMYEEDTDCNTFPHYGGAPKPLYLINMPYTVE